MWVSARRDTDSADILIWDGGAMNQSECPRGPRARAGAFLYFRPAGRRCMFRPAGAKQFLNLTVFEHPLLLHNGGSIEN